MLDELRADGLAEGVRGLWGLTPQAEAKFGAALRDLTSLTGYPRSARQKRWVLASRDRARHAAE
jgi:hypothetical protein